MKEVSLSGVSLNPVQLDVKQQPNKRLADLLALLQTGSALKGTVTEVSKDGNVIFTTTNGRFSMSLPEIPMQLSKGDKLIFKIEVNNNQIMGKITTVNGNAVKGITNIVLEPQLLESESINPNRNQTPTVISDLHSVKIPASDLRAVVTYLNLSQFNKNSLLGKALSLAKNDSSITFKIIANHLENLKSPFRTEGEVVISENGSKQIIKTPFGILTTIQDNNLPVGKKILLEVKSIDNFLVDNSNALTEVEDFIFKLNSNLPKLLNLINHNEKVDQHSPIPPQDVNNTNIAQKVDSAIPSGLMTQILNNANTFEDKAAISSMLRNSSQLATLMDNLNVKNPAEFITKLNNNLISVQQIISVLKTEKTKVTQKNSTSSLDNRSKSVNATSQDEEIATSNLVKSNNIIMKLLGSFEQKEIIQKLSEDFNKIKELLNIEIQDEDNSKWYNFSLPIYDGEKITDNKIYINKKSNRYIRFIVELSLEMTGDIQLDGLVKLKSTSSNKPENFDLAIRFKNQLNSEIQTQISELYTLSQNINGIRGILNFEHVEEFKQEFINAF